MNKNHLTTEPEFDNNTNVLLQSKTTNNSANKDIKKSKTKRLILLLIILNIGILFSSISGVCAKFASRYPILSWQFIGIYALEILFLGIYAIIWQQVIKRMQLSIAYTSKAISLIWALLFGLLIFGEKITVFNVIGILIVITGIVVVNLELWKK